MVSAGDFLAGGGGVTTGMKQIEGLEVKFVFNHNSKAIETNRFNHKNIKHYLADLYHQDEHELEKVDFVWASIECTQHSKANAGRKKKIGSYTLGWELLRYIKYINPFVVGIENVPEFKDWSPVDENGYPIKDKKGQEFERWKQTICDLGYNYHECICNAADYGLATRRVRYFAFFIKKELGLTFDFPKPTHSKTGKDGLIKWVACKKHINISEEGKSIFGRKNPLVKNTLKRIAGGIKKLHPEMQFVFQYYGNGLNVQKLESPLNTIPTHDRHALVTLEKQQFIADHCHTDNYVKLDNPLSPILTWEIKQLITLKKNFLVQHYGGDNHSSSLDNPLPTITTVDHNTLLTSKLQFISPQYNSNNKPESNIIDINDPLWAITTREKFQFITTYFNIGNKTLEQAISDGTLDFDIKMRFLYPEELSLISTFPPEYFTSKELGLTKKDQVKLIGNAVPPKWAKIMIEPVVKELNKILDTKAIAS